MRDPTAQPDSAAEPHPAAEDGPAAESDATRPGKAKRTRKRDRGHKASTTPVAPGQKKPPDAAVRNAGRPRRGRPSRKRIAQAVALIIPVVGLLTQATSLIDWIHEKLGDTPAETVAARILEVEHRSPSSLRDYKDRVREPLTGFSSEELDQTGEIFEVTMRIQGEQGQLISLRWFIVEADSGRRLRGPHFNQTPAIFKPRNQDQERGYPVWIPRPPPGVYRVTFILANSKGEQEDDEETRPFRVRTTRG